MRKRKKIVLIKLSPMIHFLINGFTEREKEDVSEYVETAITNCLIPGIEFIRKNYLHIAESEFINSNTNVALRVSEVLTKMEDVKIESRYWLLEFKPFFSREKAYYSCSTEQMIEVINSELDERKRIMEIKDGMAPFTVFETIRNNWARVSHLKETYVVLADLVLASESMGHTFSPWDAMYALKVLDSNLLYEGK